MCKEKFFPDRLSISLGLFINEVFLEKHITELFFQISVAQSMVSPTTPCARPTVETHGEIKVRKLVKLVRKSTLIKNFFSVAVTEQKSLFKPISSAFQVISKFFYTHFRGFPLTLIFSAKKPEKTWWRDSENW